MSIEQTNTKKIKFAELVGSNRKFGVASGRSSDVRKANDWLANFLFALIAVSPIPLGSNRPAFWAISAVFVAFASLLYFVRLQRLNAPLRFSTSRFRFIGSLFGIFLAALIIQILPIGTFEFRSFQGFIFTSPTLSIAPGETTLMILRQMSYGLFFFLVLQVSVNQHRAQKLLFVIFSIATAHALIGLASLSQFGDTTLFLEKTAYLGSATGTFINRNSYATFLAMGVICGTSLLLATELESGRKTTRSLPSSVAFTKLSYLVALAILIAAILTTQSRMGTFSMACGMAVVGVITAVATKQKLLRVVGAALSASLAVLAGLGSLFGSGLLERLGSVDSSLDVRSQLYQQVAEMSFTRPFLGFGGGSFNLAYPLFHRDPVSPDLIWDKAHSSYLALWSELGFIFGSIPIVIFVAIGVVLLRTILSKRENTTTSIAAFGALVVVALHSLLDFSLEIQANTYLLLAIVALGFADRPSPPADVSMKNRA